MSGAAFGAQMREFLEQVEHANLESVERVAHFVVDCWAAGGLVYAAGAGHSLAAVNETFYRAGGLGFVRPVYDGSLFPLNGAQASTDAERLPGLAAEVFGRYSIGPADVLIVFSNSGINWYPVELTEAGRASGATVIAVTSRAASAVAPPRADHRLYEVADEVLDTLVPPGDAAWPPEAPVTGPLSSLANMFLWNLVLAAVAAEADRRGVELPLWRSANAGAEAANGALFETYAARVPELGT